MCKSTLPLFLFLSLWLLWLQLRSIKSCDCLGGKVMAWFLSYKSVINLYHIFITNCIHQELHALFLATSVQLMFLIWAKTGYVGTIIIHVHQTVKSSPSVSTAQHNYTYSLTLNSSVNYIYSLWTLSNFPLSRTIFDCHNHIQLWQE